jgi:hypothetical protein
MEQKKGTSDDNRGTEMVFTMDSPLFDGATAARGQQAETAGGDMIGLPSGTVDRQADVFLRIEALLEQIAKNTGEKEDKLADDEKHLENAKALFDGFDKLLGMIPLIGWYIKKRYNHSAVKHYLEGIDLSMQDADTAVNMITLVQALLLTIVPAVMVSVVSTNGTWSNLQSNIEDCGYDNTDSMWLTNVWFPLWSSAVGALIGSIAGILIAVMYFILRPTGTKHFEIWYKTRGIIAIICMGFCIVINIVCTALILIYLLIWLLPSGVVLCDQVAAVVYHGNFALSPFMRQAITLAFTFGGIAMLGVIFIIL